MDINSVYKNLIATFTKLFSNNNIPAFELILPNGEKTHFGKSSKSSPDTVKFIFHVRTAKGITALNSLDEYAIAEAYINGDFDFYGDFLEAFALRQHFTDNHQFRYIWRFIRSFLKGQDKTDRSAISNHYDKGNNFYLSFLDDKHRLYSQAIYLSEKEALETAGDNKMQYIYDICRLKPGARILDLGAGWGSFSKFAASRGIDVTMLTLSNEQFKYLSELSSANTGVGKLQPVMQNIYSYNTDKPFDAIVLLGVMEHLPDYQALFQQFDHLLVPNGHIYMDFVAMRKKYKISTFTYQYVFQGNHSPVVMPDLLAASNNSPFEILAIHNDRHSYFLTVKQWALRLEAARDLLVAAHGEQDFRLFQLYLWALADCLYRYGALESYRVVYQKTIGQLSHNIGTYRRM